MDLNDHDPKKLHIHDSVQAGINRGAANGRISAVVGDHYGEADAGNVSIQVSGCRGRWFPGGKQDIRSCGTSECPWRFTIGLNPARGVSNGHAGLRKAVCFYSSEYLTWMPCRNLRSYGVSIVRTALDFDRFADVAVRQSRQQSDRGFTLQTLLRHRGHRQ